MKVLLKYSFDATLVDRHLKREASRHVYIRHELGPLNALLDVAAISLWTLSYRVPESNLFHMTTFIYYLRSYTKALKDFQGSRLQSICLASLQCPRFGVQTKQRRTGNAISGQ
jgi:hypothetical protein